MLRQSINRLLKVSFAESKEQTENLPALNNIQFECIPRLTASQIIQVLDLQSQLHSIQQLAGISDTHFQFLYRPAINNILEAAQLVPSSASHHHCGPGGFVIHTIEVIELALRQQRAKTLPLLADPEQIADKEHQWTYSIFYKPSDTYFSGKACARRFTAINDRWLVNFQLGQTAVTNRLSCCL